MRQAKEAVRDSTSFLGVNRLGIIVLPSAWAILLMVLAIRPDSRLPTLDAAKGELFFAASLFAIVLLVLFAYYFVLGTPRRLEREDAVAEEQQRMDLSNKEQAKNMLRRVLRDPRYKIKYAFLFGSIVHDHRPMADIDIGICINSDRRRVVRRVVKLLNTEVEPLLEDAFHLPIHWQRFLDSEVTGREAFLKKAGSYESLIGQ